MRKKEEIKDILYAALDETNHSRYPALFISLFSWIPQDISPMRYVHGNRDYRWLHRFMSKGMSSGERDYRFLMIEQKDFLPARRNNLPYIAPCLIIPYLAEHKCREIQILIDGEVSLEEERMLRQNMHSFFTGGIHVSNYVKDSHAKVQSQPALLRAADEQIHYLFRKKLQDLGQEKYSSRRVSVIHEIRIA